MADLKPGGMGQAAFTGVPPEFVGSMAQAMEDAYRQLLVDDGKDTFSVTGNTEQDRDRRRLFVALAQGVVGHLVANADAFRVLFDGTSNWWIEIDQQ